MNIHRLTSIVLFIIVGVVEPVNNDHGKTSKERSLYDGSLRNDNTEVIYEYYEVSGDEDEDEPVAQKQVDAVTHPPVKQSPSVPRPLPPAPPAPRPQSSPSLPQRPATQQSSSLNIPLSQPSPPAIRPPPSFGQTNSERTLVAQVPLAQVPIQERMQPILTPPPPTTPTPFDPADFEPVVFGITSLPASKFIGIEKPKPAPPQPFQNNNFYGSLWAPWSAWGICQNSVQMRVRACNTVVGFSCFGTNQETISCTETMDDHPSRLFEPEVDRLPVVKSDIEVSLAREKPAKEVDRGNRQPKPKQAAATAPPPPNEVTAPPPPPEEGQTAPPPPTEASALPPPVQTTIRPTTRLPTTPAATTKVTLPSTTVATSPTVLTAQTSTVTLSSITTQPTTIAIGAPAPVPITNPPAPGNVVVLTFVPFNPVINFPEQPIGIQPPPGYQGSGSVNRVTPVIPQLPAPIDMNSGNFVWNKGDTNIPSINYIQIQPVPGAEITGDNGPAPVPVAAYGGDQNWGQNSGFSRGSAPINEASNWNNWSSWSTCKCGRQSRTRTCDFNNAALTTGCAGLSYQIIQCGGTGGTCSLTGGGIPTPTDVFSGPTFPGAFPPSYQAPAYKPGQIPASSFSSSGIYGNYPKPPGTEYGPPAVSYSPPVQPQKNSNLYSNGGGYGYGYNYYPPPPTAGPDLFNVWLDGVWQPTAVWQPPPSTTTLPPLNAYGFPIPGGEGSVVPTEVPNPAFPTVPTVAPIPGGPTAPTFPTEATVPTESTVPTAPTVLLSGGQLPTTVVSAAATTEEEEEEETTTVATTVTTTVPPFANRLAKAKGPSQEIRNRKPG